MSAWMPHVERSEIPTQAGAEGRTVESLKKNGFTSVHWSAIGSPTASDYEILEWAMQNRYIVFTHDLDFGTILALTQANGPSVLQVRGQNILPEAIAPLVVKALNQYNKELEAGALIVIDETRSRVRILPFE